MPQMYEQEVVTFLRPSLCEVNYDLTGDLGSWSEGHEGEIHTPYRYRGLSATQKTGNYGPPSPSLYNPTTVGCRTPQSLTLPYRTNTSLSLFSNGPGVGSHIPNLTYNQPDLTVQDDPTQFPARKRSDRARTAPCEGSLLPGGVPGSHGNGKGRGRSESAMIMFARQGEPGERLRWVPALNTWIVQKENQNPVPYMNFVSTANFTERGYSKDLEIGNELPVLPCSRFLSHMNMHEDTIRALYAQKNAQLSNQKQKRDKRIADVLSNKGQSQPMYTIPKVSKPATDRPAHPSHTPKLPPPNKPGQPPPPPPPPPQVVMETTAPSSAKRSSASEDSTYLDAEVVEDEDDGEAPDVLRDSPKQDLDIIHEGPSVGTMTDKVAPPLPRTTVSTKPDKSKRKTSPRKSKPAPKKDVLKKKKSKDGAMKDSNVSKVDLEEPPMLQLKVKSEKEPSPPPAGSETANHLMKNSAEKRVRWRAQPMRKKKEGDASDTDQSEGWKKREGEWLYGDDDYSTTMVQTEQGTEDNTEATQVLAPPPVSHTPSPSSTPQPQKKREAPRMSADLSGHQWGLRRRDAEWEEEQKRLRLAQERRDKAQEMYERLRRKRYKDGDDVDLTGGPNFEESDEEIEPEEENHLDGWLAKYCIFQRGNLQMFKRTFDIVDESRRGYLGPVDTIVALRTVNNRLSLSEEEYVYRILDLVGYNIMAGADFKLFAVMAALTQRIASLDDWMKHLIGNMDFSTLERKMYMCKSLWECNVDPETNKISIDQLCVELRAGGVSYEHECEVRDRLGHLGALDLIDFMTYIPLFIMIHESVLSNPLDDSRRK